MSEAELRKMLDHAREQYARSVTLNDLALWRKRIQDLEAELKELQGQASLAKKGEKVSECARL